jgi:uncharacterized RDD family membrane protein YckC
MQCPKCKKEASSAIECEFCGIIFDKYQKRVKMSDNNDTQGNKSVIIDPQDSTPEHFLEYPTLTRRYFATAIDVGFVLMGVILTSYFFENVGATGVKIRVGLILFLFFGYEPLCTSQICTIGQRIMGIRVRRYPSLERISLLMAYTRIIVKALLGTLSFFTLPFSKNRRAIHDMAARSIVVFYKDS